MPDLSTLSMPFNPAGIELDRRQGLSRQLYQALRLRVLDGRLASGTRLPASRDLAAALAISRNSVVRAYDQLYAEGFIEGRVGDGTYVAQLPRDPLKTKNYPQKYPQGFQHAYPQPYPQILQIPLCFHPVKLSTAAFYSGCKTTIYPIPPVARRAHFALVYRHSICFRLTSGPSSTGLSGANRTFSRCVTATRPAMRVCAA